jgi:hypothetical protein
MEKMAADIRTMRRHSTIDFHAPGIAILVAICLFAYFYFRGKSG